MASNISLVITSCNRHDLLHRTLQSLIETTDMPPQETFIVEDSDTPMPDWLKEQPYRSLFITWLQNGSRMGQIYSIDRLYSDIKTDYVFHCEDDWLFVESGGWMRKSKEILDAHPEVIQVSLRGDTGWHPLVRRGDLLLAEPNWREGWGGLSFNPGLRRLSDYKKLGSYGRHVAYGAHGLGHELQLSKMHLKLGYVIADLGYPIVQHIGAGRSRAIEPLPAMPKILIAIPACHKYEYGKWESEQSPHFDPANKPYGSDIHISGTNDRIQALRETWLKDIDPFKAHVDYRFFYGGAHPLKPLPFPDEEYLDCPDDYEHLPHKTIAICKWALDHDYAYLFKCDDDTAVYVDRLVRELMTHKFDYAGYEHSGVCTGGPGYWLSRRAMAVVARSKPTSWAEDVTVGHAMSTANIRPIMLPSHRPGGACHWYFGDSFDPSKVNSEQVTLHAIQPEVMRAWHQYITQ